MPVDAFAFSVFMFCIVYMVVPALMQFSEVHRQTYESFDERQFSAIVVGLAMLYVGYYFSLGIPLLRIRERTAPTSRARFRFLFFLVFLAGVAVYLYAVSFGGILAALSSGALMRYTGQEVIEVTNSAIFLYFVGLAAVAISMAQFRLYIVGAREFRCIFLLVTATVVMLLYGLISASRGVIINVLLLMLYIHINVRGIRFNVKFLFSLAAFLLVGLFFVSYGKPTISAISKVAGGEKLSVAGEAIEGTGANVIFDRLLTEFSHPTVSLSVTSKSANDHTYMSHFFLAPLHFIPTRLLGMESGKPPRITEENTFQITGSTEGGIPPGLVASFWYGGGLAGVVFGMFVFGVGLGWFQRQCFLVMKRIPDFRPIGLVLYFHVGWFVNGGDLSVWLKSTFPIFVSIVLFVVFIRFSTSTIKVPCADAIGKRL